jgi:hypothetical protein
MGAVALTALLTSWSAADAQSTGASEIRLDFEDAQPGGLPQAFKTSLTGKGGAVKWVVLEDRTAPVGPKVLAETSGDSTSNRFPLAILEAFQAKDVEVSVRFKPISGKVDQAAGLMMRVRDENNYYIARANALENNVRLYKVVDGRRQQFAGVDVPVANGRWQQLTLRVEGDRFTVGLDGKVLFYASDSTFTDAGQVGLWTKADSVTHFDEMVVRRIP